MGGLCLLPTLSTGKANQGSELLIMPRDTDTSRESSETLSMTQVVVLHLLLSISVILTDTRSRRKSLFLQKVCTPDSLFTAERSPRSPSETLCQSETCPREPSSATSRRRPETVASSPGPAATTPPSSPTTPTPREPE